MRAFLMYKDKDFDLNTKLPFNANDLIQDLELSRIFDAMAKGNEFFYKVSKVAILSSLTDIETILYRQEVLKDCLANLSTVKRMYEITLGSFDVEKKTFFGFFNKYPIGMLDSSIKAMQILLESMIELRKLSDEESEKFHSKGFKRFFDMVKDELSDEYFDIVKKHLKTLEFRDGMLIGVELGSGNKGINYTLLKPNEGKKRWFSKVFSRDDEYVFRIDERDQNGPKALSELKERGINQVSNALTQSVDHVLNFFKNLNTELAFYLAAANLYETLKELAIPLTFPFPVDTFKCSFIDLHDPSLALTLKSKTVGNTLNVNDKKLFIITGANRGGKSTFLRSVGIATLLMQSGMFVPAKRFLSNISNGIFTHFKREEDENMESGKFDEELRRMSNIADHLTPYSIILFNESFSSTNEVEGSEIAKEIVSALREKEVEIFFVTHMYEFAHTIYRSNLNDAVFLVAQRLESGERTFKIKEGIPSQTSFGIDLYRKIWFSSV
jgi:DNA mismatch repair ATPase MutS